MHRPMPAWGVKQTLLPHRKMSAFFPKVKKAKFKMRQEFNSRLTYSLFCVHLSNQKFGDSVGDARTTKLPRRESAAPAARITDKSVSAQCAPSARQRKGPEMPGQPSLPPRAKSKLANILRRGGGRSRIRTCLHAQIPC